MNRMAVFMLLAFASICSAGESDDAHRVFASFGMIYINKPAASPTATLKALCGQESGFKHVDPAKQPQPEGSMVISAELTTKEWTVPGVNYLSRFGRGIDQKTAVSMQKAKAIFMTGFTYPRKLAKPRLKRICAMLHRVATKTGGILYDEITREAFSLDEWKKRRVDSWQGDVPDATAHITIHVYPERKLLRGITLGMQKFGCPDVVVNDFPRSYFKTMGTLINLTSQSLAETNQFEIPNLLTLKIDALKHKKRREWLAESLVEEAAKKLPLRTARGKAEEGDPDNPLLEITFEGLPGKTPQERQNALLSKLFGAEDELTRVKHSDDIMAASARAKKKLLALKPQFVKGFPTGERLLVKGPFKTDDGGREWMWLEVVTWKDGSFHGLLMNDPFKIKKLKAGAKVSITEAEAFDYLHYRANGTTDGNETGKIMMRQQQSK